MEKDLNKSNIYKSFQTMRRYPLDQTKKVEDNNNEYILDGVKEIVVDQIKQSS
ncbi:hypothetical protein CANARDRAFT_28093 [[Candida] arabinofermentans NRRL YB-2248]|uniref:Uncharacterized protein n=1 Tax=[Candida] arabinofermentans NRRL YB-2248 TaxID=983967 RepID=A0A1E4T2R6_9ASCO|nr:hypothetical protein CANARDRAFT_28093 [[Candida] arabinofermentans NRRL YB-2248]